MMGTVSQFIGYLMNISVVLDNQQLRGMLFPIQMKKSSTTTMKNSFMTSDFFMTTMKSSKYIFQ